MQDEIGLLIQQIDNYKKTEGEIRSHIEKMNSEKVSIDEYGQQLEVQKENALQHSNDLDDQLRNTEYIVSFKSACVQ